MNHKKWMRLFPIVALGLFSTWSWADYVTLKDGREISGTLHYDGEKVTITHDDGSVTNTTRSEIVKVKLVGAMSEAELAGAEWTRLQANIKKIDSLDKILSTLDSFIQEYEGTTGGAQGATTKTAGEVGAGVGETLAKAKESKAFYQKAQAEGYVRFRNEWMPHDQADALRKDSEEQATQALVMYQGRQWQDAINQARKALAVDETNATALIVSGLGSLRLNQPAVGRTYFLKAAESDPKNILVLNNLAILTFALGNRDPEAISYYLRALEVVPQNRLLLDNIAEALHGYTGPKNAKSLIDLTKLDQQAEADIAPIMAALDLYRYGSSWVSKEHLDALTGNMANIKKTMDVKETAYKNAAKQFASDAKELQAVDKELDKTYRNFWTVSRNINSRLSNGQPVDYDLLEYRDDLIAKYNDLLNRRSALLDRVKMNRESMLADKPEMERLADAINLANGQLFTGEQKIMEIGDVEKPPKPRSAMDIPPQPQTPQAALVPVRGRRFNPDSLTLQMPSPEDKVTASVPTPLEITSPEPKPLAVPGLKTKKN